jgi:nitrate/nitrite-specific signal transduction histidine kinase
LGHEKLGGIRLGFDLKPIEQEIAEATYRVVAVASAILIFGLIVIFVITIRMIKPLERLTLAAKRIETGELGYRVHIERDDEIGALATASIRWVSA